MHSKSYRDLSSESSAFRKLISEVSIFHTQGVISNLYHGLKNSIISYFWLSLDIFPEIWRCNFSVKEYNFRPPPKFQNILAIAGSLIHFPLTLCEQTWQVSARHCKSSYFYINLFSERSNATAKLPLIRP